MEYLDLRPGIDRADGCEGVPLDLKVEVFGSEDAPAESCVWTIEVAASKRRSRRISASSSSWVRRRCSKRSALALPHLENRISLGPLGFGFGNRDGAKIGKGVLSFNDIAGETEGSEGLENLLSTGGGSD